MAQPQVAGARAARLTGEGPATHKGRCACQEFNPILAPFSFILQMRKEQPVSGVSGTEMFDSQFASIMRAAGVRQPLGFV